MRYSILLIFLLSTISWTQASVQEPVFFKVTNYTIDGVNYDRIALSEDMALAFYYDDNQNIAFANMMRNANSQSYGGVYSLKESRTEETDTTYASQELKFTWNFFNTYDSDRGIAAITFTRIFIENTVKFTCEMVILETNRVLKMQGYQEE